MKTNRFVQILIVLSFISISFLTFLQVNSWQLKDAKRVKFCSRAKPLTAIATDQYDVNGVKYRGGTLFRKIALKPQRTIPVIIFPQSLSAKVWFKFPQSSIYYLGWGGDKSWQEWLQSDNFYLLEVPPQVKGLAFGRLCYRNGDVGVHTIHKLEQIAPQKLVINDKIYLSLASPLAEINSSHIIVNAGSDRRDILGGKTEVYFTTEDMIIPN
ncbi:hypothetical protein Nos7524_2140 [Nostoc sp. PCC 7524]|uniref:hypothetical protein n=1 Tax=Nostoc sp. (strain ATCC 29411 / PCC 7524) TaxID=28072 RepID=UPI00029F330B|nr:hypothetical protein [Nostoc sp. PCC 7524]AFY47990.1 hypothetical protein Nos7524_2140 [Nostoc sp. PCC 7524]